MSVETPHILRRPPYEWIYPLILGLPLLVFALDLAWSGFLSESMAEFVSRALVVNDRAKMELIGFTKPPLALLPLVLYPTTTAAVLLSALWLGMLSYLLIEEAVQHRRFVPMIAVGVLYLTPVFVQLAAAYYAETLALLLLYIAWRYYRHWTRTGITGYGFKAGMLLGLAELATPFALPLAVAAGALLPAYRAFSFKKYLAAWLILVFPPLVSMLTWTLLGWLFTGVTIWPYPGTELVATGVVEALLLSPLYLAVGLIVVWRDLRHIIVYLIPLGLLGFGYAVGWDFSLPFALALLLMFAADALRERTSRSQRGLSVVAAGVQIVLLWAYMPWPSESDVDGYDQAVGRTMAQAPAGSVLAGGDRLDRFITSSATASPFVLSIDDRYEVVLTSPGDFVPYVLTCPGVDRLYRRYGSRPPEGFVQEWAWEGCRLYRRFDADPLQLDGPFRSSRMHTSSVYEVQAISEFLRERLPVLP